jgi:hypothetical protein
VIGGAAMKKPRWPWASRAQARELAEEAEAARDKAHREVVVPLRKMRSGDFLSPAIARDIRQQQRESG